MNWEIGFMQGRLSPLMFNRIQTFPSDYWKDEIHIANLLGFSKMEWTIDTLTAENNPMHNPSGHKEIAEVLQQFHVDIPSVTLDIVMENPFWRCSSDQASLYRIEELKQIIENGSAIGTKYFVIPLVDNGSLKGDKTAEERMVAGIDSLFPYLDANQALLFETDYPASHFLSIIEQFRSGKVGINFDSGNTAALGFDIALELKAYKGLVMNVHIKDRIRNGSTVPLGQGDVNFDVLVSSLREFDYSGNLILQTARSECSMHIAEILRCREFIQCRL